MTYFTIFMVIVGIAAGVAGGIWLSLCNDRAVEQSKVAFAEGISTVSRNTIERLIANCNQTDTSTMAEAHSLICADVQKLNADVAKRVLPVGFYSDSIVARTTAVREVLESYYLPKAIKSAKES